MRPCSPTENGGEIDLQLPLDIPVSLAPRASHAPTARSAPHALLARAQYRLLWVGGAFAVVFLVVALRLVDAMILSSGGGENGASLPPPSPALSLSPFASGSAQDLAALGVRADIVDRKGELLATSLPTKSLYADPKMIIDPEAAARGLVRILPDMKYEDVLEKLRGERRFVWLKRNLTPEEVFQVNALGQPGLDFKDEYMRIYPAGASMVQIIGVTDVDGAGLSGVERGLDKRLREEPMSPVELSVDLRIQHILERELQTAVDSFRAIGGAGVVMDVWSGEVLAAVSLPTFAPAKLAEAGDEARFNRFALGSYELGSVMKVINTAAALDSGKIHFGDYFDAANPVRYGRFTINDYHPVHRKLSVEEIFLYSSNIGSARMALTMGGGFQRDFMCKLGFCEPLRTELSEAGLPQVPSDWKELRAMTASFGHGFAVTPLQFMRAAAATINGGYLPPVTFLKREDSVRAPLGQMVLKPSTADAMRRVMRANVTEKAGSGKKAEALGYLVGGKTGTAEKSQGRRYSKNAKISSFIGAFPMHSPRYMVFVMLDEPQPNKSTFGYATGGWVAAPVVGHVIAQMGPLLGMAPAREDDPAIQQALQLTVRSQAGASAGGEH